MRRGMLFTAALLLGMVLPGWSGRAAAQSVFPQQTGPRDGSPIPPLPSNATNREVIATTQTPLPQPTPAAPEGSAPSPPATPVIPVPVPEVRGPSQATVPAQSSAQQPAESPGDLFKLMEALPGIGGKTFAASDCAVHVEKIGPATGSAGTPYRYEVVVRNYGATPVSLVVHDKLPAGSRLLSADPPMQAVGEALFWSVGTVAPGKEAKLKVEVLLGPASEIDANVTAVFAVSSRLQARVTSEPAASPLTLSVAGPESVRTGEDVVFQIEMQNTGNQPASNIVLRNRLPAGLKHPQGDFIEADIGTLGPGERKKVTLHATAISAGRQINESSVLAGDGPEATARTTVLVEEARLLVCLTGPQESLVNRELNFRINAANSGTGPVQAVRVSHMLPEGFGFLSASDGGIYNASTRKVEWRLGTLLADQARAVTARVRADKVGDWLNRAAVCAESGSPTWSELNVHIEGEPGLAVSVFDKDDPVAIGAETHYVIRIVNQGHGPADNLLVVASVPDGMKPLGGDGPTTARIQGQQVTFDGLEQLAVGKDVVYRLRVRAQKAGDWKFKVSVSADHLRKALTEEESTRVNGDEVRLTGANP